MLPLFFRSLENIKDVNLTSLLVLDGAENLPLVLPYIKETPCYRVLPIVFPSDGLEQEADSSRVVRSRKQMYQHLANMRNFALQKIVELVETNSTVLTIDSDILVKPSIVSELMLHEKDFIASLVINDSHIKLTKKLDDLTDRHCNFGMLSTNKYKAIKKFTKNSLLTVDVSGACFLISLESIKTLLDNTDGKPYTTQKSGEDEGFCRNYSTLIGEPIWVDTTLRTIHIMLPTRVREATVLYNKLVE
jgi:hypothetical protein